MAFDFEFGHYTLRHAPWTIRDKPRFPHRGLMFDSARHFEPVAAIKRLIDSLTYAKLNGAWPSSRCWNQIQFALEII